MAETKGNVLVVDDEKGMLEFLEVILTREGYAPVLAGHGKLALELFDSRDFDVVLQDIRLPGLNGIELLQKMKDSKPRVPVIVMTAFSTWDTAVEAMRCGAYDYIKKPFDTDEIRATLARAFQTKLLTQRISLTGDEELSHIGNIIGHSPRMQEVYDLIRRVAPTDSTVLIQGESGTGKELVARAVHYRSYRATEPFLAINCGAFPETLLESELFGHIKGSFTGAIADKKGLLEIADKGTFFLDEVSEMRPQTQVKLLRVLEDRHVMPLGSTTSKRIDMRFIAATNMDLEQEVAVGSFRRDLYYRLNVINIGLPPLREKREDVPLLAGHFLARYGEAMGKSVTSFSRDALEVLIGYDWPGNVRELENVVQRAVALTDASQIDVPELPAKLAPSASAKQASLFEVPEEGLDLEAWLAEAEKAFLLRALRRTDWNLTEAARLLRMSFRSIRYKVKKHKLKEHSS